jgi:hypothetical protein
VLTHNTANNTFLLFVYGSNLQYEKKILFDDKLYAETDHAFERMVLSETDSNVFYLLTHNTVYKKFFSNPTKTFAVFVRSKFGQSPVFKWEFETINWQNENKRWNFDTSIDVMLADAAIITSEQGFDNMFVLGSGQILHLQEKVEFDTVLRNPKLPCYGYKSMQLDYTENIQAVTINKELYKMYSNILQMKNNIKGRFNFEYSLYGDLEYRDYVYLTDADINKLNVSGSLNTKVNDNELVQAGTINKLFVQIYKLLQSLIDLTQPRVFNFRNIVVDNNVVMIE